MRYTHYWKRQEVIKLKTMKSIVADFKKIMPVLDEAKVDLADGDGTGEAIISNEVVRFNGREDCGHQRDKSIGIEWPAELAGGVGNQYKEDAKVGNWFAGATLATRVCGGNCSHETFYFPRILKIERWQERGEDSLYFAFTKTAFKPYDLAVTAFLIIAKKHIGTLIVVSSDGEDEHWLDAKMICQIELGYGADFEFDAEGHLQGGVS